MPRTEKLGAPQDSRVALPANLKGRRRNSSIRKRTFKKSRSIFEEDPTLQKTKHPSKQNGINQPP
jgi:hypothetical protein